MSLPEQDQRVLRAIAVALEVDEFVQIPLDVEGLSEAQVIKSVLRLDKADPKLWIGIDVAEERYPIQIMELTERGLREAGVWPGTELPRAATSSTSGGNAPFAAQVVRVLLASPSDVAEERDRIAEVIHQWNADHAEDTRTVLMPVRWETHATAEAGGHPQEILNRQIVDTSHMLIGVFWTRLGTATPKSASGTAEEIGRMLDADKPVSLFFSSRPVRPDSIDQDQYTALREFRTATRETALTYDFEDLRDLERHVRSAITRTVRERFGVEGELIVGGPAAPRAAVRAAVIDTYSSSGSKQHRLQLQNLGVGTAHDVSIELTPTGGSDKAWGIFDAEEPIEFLASGGVAEFLLMIYMGSPRRTNCTVRWRNDDGSEGVSKQTLTP
jgi:hypothetical protein